MNLKDENYSVQDSQEVSVSRSFKKMARKSRRRQTITNSQMKALQTKLVSKILAGFRNRLKILFYAQPLRVLPPPTLFSWYLRDFRARMSVPNLMFLTKFEESSKNVQQAAKMNAELKTMIEIADFLVEDYSFRWDLEDLEHLINDMQQLLKIQNTLIESNLDQKRLYKSLEKRLDLADSESAIEIAERGSVGAASVAGDEFAFEELVLSAMTYHHVSERYTKQFKQAQLEQLDLTNRIHESGYLKTIAEYHEKYHREKAVFQSIEQANEHIINKLEGEISIMNHKYDYECDQLDFECNRKKNEILAVTDKSYTMRKKMQEMIDEIGDEILSEVMQPTVWTILNKLALERELRKLAQQEKKIKGKKDNKSKKKTK